MAYFPYVTLASGISINSRFFVVVFFKMADEFKVCGVERRRHLSLLRTIRKCYYNLLVSASCLLVVIVNAYF